MGKRIASILFVAGVFLLSVTLAVGMLFAGPSRAGANEILAEAPVLTDKEGNWNLNLLPDTARWFGDRFFLRQELISVNNYLTAHLFGTSAAEDVVLGSQGWLYYGATVADYTGTAPMTEREIFSAARNLSLLAEYAREKGSPFLFIVAPNKNSLYPAHMPFYGVTAETKNVWRLFDCLEEMEVPYLDLYALFGAEAETLYFAHDSHWNSKGAALAADAINAAFDRESSYFKGDFSGSEPHQGDLFEMLYPAFADEERNPVYGGPLDFSYASKATQPDSITLLTESNGTGSLLVYRDSFGILLYPYLADSFAAARFSRSTNYDLTLEADYIVVELVERNLRYLITYAAVMPSPERELALPEPSGSVEVQTSTVRGQEGMVQIQGTLPDGVDADSPVYVCCGGKIYEAFCLENNSFAANLPENATLEGVAFLEQGAVRLLTIS